MVCCEQVDMAQHLWVNAAHNRGPRCAVLQELKPLGGDTHAGRSALKRRRLPNRRSWPTNPAPQPALPALAWSTPPLPVVALRKKLRAVQPRW